MAFTVQQVLDAALIGADISMTASEAIAAVNEAIGWLGDMAYNQVIAWYDVAEDSLSIELPSNTIHIESIRGDSANCEVVGHTILLDRPGKFRVVYRCMPDKVTSTDDYVPLHDLYEQPLITYLRQWAMLLDEEDSTEGNNLRQLWMQDATRVFGQLKRNRRGPSTARSFRDARHIETYSGY